MLENANFFLVERSRFHYWRGAGLASIKLFSGGEALYDIGGGAFRVNGDSYLLLNSGQAYTISIDSQTPVESFCVFFADGFAEQVSSSLSSSAESLLDEPSQADVRSKAFFQRTYPHDFILSPALRYARAAYPLRKGEPGWLEEQFHHLMARLLARHEQTYREAESFPALRAATREELYRRLYLARDTILALHDQPLTLETIARAACLSPNHLMRTFKSAFGQTPYQFLTDERLRQAARLLATTEIPITDICMQVGYESLGSFSWLFRRRFGLSPTDYRMQKR